MTQTDHASTDALKPGRERVALLPLAVGASAVGVCCGLPLLGSLAAAGAIAGPGAESWIAAALASSVTFIGVRGWRRTLSCLCAPNAPPANRAFAVTETLPSSRS